MKDYGVEGFVEVKEPRHSVHPSQKRTLEELRKLGVKIGIVRVVKGEVVEEVLGNSVNRPHPQLVKGL